MAASMLMQRDGDFRDDRRVQNINGMLSRINSQFVWGAVCEATSWISESFIRDGEIGIPKVGPLHLVPLSTLGPACATAIRQISANVRRYNTTKKQLQFYRISVANEILLWLRPFATTDVEFVEAADDAHQKIAELLGARLSGVVAKDGDDLETIAVRRFIEEIQRL